MASFADALKPADTAAIRAFMIARANELKNAPPLGARRRRPIRRAISTSKASSRAARRDLIRSPQSPGGSEDRR